MNNNERTADFGVALDAALDSFASGLWTCLPAIIKSVDFGKQTITAQSCLQVGVSQKGKKVNTKMPLFLDVPLLYPKCQNFALTMPVKAGDEVLLVFGSRCIDSWWAQGGADNVEYEERRHDLSDAFAILAPTSLPKSLKNVSTENVQLRNTAGDVFVEITPAGNVRVEAKNVEFKIKNNITLDAGGNFDLKCSGFSVKSASAKIAADGGCDIEAGTASVKAGSIKLDGAVTVAGAMTQAGAGGEGASFASDVTIGGTSFKGHTHGGVKAGGDNTAPPN